jgi:O-antigen/teichoic acid export membrane protein
MKLNTKAISVQAKAAIWFTVCNFLQKGIAFIVVPIFTRIMSTEQYGTYTVYVSWYQILNIITSLYLFNGVYDNALSKYDKDRDRVTSSFLGLTILITACVSLLCFALRSKLSSLTGLSFPFLALMFTDALLTPSLAYWTARQRFEYRYKLLVIVTISKSILTPMVAIWLVNRSGGLAIGRAVAVVLSDIVYCGFFFILQFANGKTAYDRKYWKYALKLGIPMIPHYLSGIILAQGDRIVIDKYLGKTDVALYGLASSIGMLVQIFVASVNSAITPWMYEKMKKGKPNEMKETLTFLMLFIALTATGLMLLCPEITVIFGSSKYSESVGAIPPIAASVFFIFLYGILAFPQFYFEKTAFLSVASFIAAALNIILNIIFVPILGYIAAAYTTLACYVFYCIGHWIVSKRIMKENNYPDYIDNRAMIGISVILIGMSFLVVYLINYRLIRFLLILLIVVFLGINYKKVVYLLKSALIK